MIYEKFEDFGNGTLYMTRRPLADSSTQKILHAPLKITKLKKNGKMLKGFNVVKNKLETVSLTTVESSWYIIGDSRDEVLKKKVKMVFRFREQIIAKHNTAISSLDKELGSTFFKCLEENPDIMI